MLLGLIQEKLRYERINWKIMQRTAQCLFVLCFRERGLKALKSENILRQLVDLMIKALDSKEMETVIALIKLFTFFSDD